ncbi:hypothetical protein BKP35_16440 [Anaerobacillus arseniciselenatis]|uniref:Uncharacterized protein n=1 Tax=Anaerobacillus arseniciselenatis TaxID=85682 RepID=A0A1S2LAD2_9BACI|nr:hypothetical protein [Anaerobacillus arseniciselenatis]OIJ09442.1 hypothetical protein BKP35_16440 [Anaerobacillus arseniciselenatis]
MGLRTLKEISDRKIQVYTLFFFVLFLTIPTPVYASGEKWYMKPFEWMVAMFFEYILSPFLGIHEPAYYIFYQGDGLIWGLYTQEQFAHAIQTGFHMMLFIVSFMLVTSIMKIGVQNVYGRFSASMKVDLMDNGLKILIAIVLLFQFFPIMNIFFTINMYGVSLFESGISEPTSLTDLGADILTSADGTKSPGDEITFTDLDNSSNNPIKNAIVSFFSLGVSIWFKAYYIQRIFIISALIILAPLWISAMFFPKLERTTSTAFRELWAQIMAQVIHAATFFLYFWLFDGSEDWFTYIIALALFIPVSESIRFAMGATSENAGRLAMVGTLAGAGSLLHMGKAANDIRQGSMNSFAERKGVYDGPRGTSNGPNGGGGGGMSPTSESNGRQYGGTGHLNASPNKFTRNMRSFGHVASGVGSAMLRTGGYAAGMGINPIAGHFAAEGGSEVGKNAGYGSGVLSYAGAKGIQGKARNAQQGFNQNYQSSMDQGRNRVQATLSGIGGGLKEGTVSSDFKNNPNRRNEVLQKTGGAVGESMYGRGIGYHMGSETATKYAGKGVEDIDLARLNVKKTYAVVTSNKGSYLAEKGENNQLVPRTNMRSGDPSLPNDQMIIQEYKIESNKDGIRSFKPSTSQYSINQVPANNGSGANQWKKAPVEQQANQPNIQEFLNKNSPPNKV